MWHGKQETEGILYLMRLLRMSNNVVCSLNTSDSISWIYFSNQEGITTWSDSLIVV